LLAASTASSLVIGLALAIAGLLIGLPALAGLLPRGTLRAAPGLPAAVLSRGFLTFAFFGAQAYVPLALIGVRGTSATEAGLALTAATLSWSGGSWLQAHGQATWGARRLVAAGFVLVLVGVVVSAPVLLPSVPIAVVAIAWGIAGFGMGLAYPSLSLMVLAEADAPQVGFATSALQLTDVLGTSVGTGAGGAVIAIATAAGASAATGIGFAFGLAIVVAAAGLALSRRLVSGSQATRRLSASGEPA
jgi:hypothetical protein